MPWVPSLPEQRREPGQAAPGQAFALEPQAFFQTQGDRSQPEAGIADLHAVERILAAAAGTLAGTASLLCGATLAVRRCSGSIAALPGPVGLLAVCGAGMLLVAVSDAAARAAGRTGATGRFGTIASRIGLVTALLAMTVPLLVSTGDAAAPGGMHAWGVSLAPSDVARAAAVVVAVLAASGAILGPWGADGSATRRARPRRRSTRVRTAPPEPAQPPEKTAAAEVHPAGGRPATAAESCPGHLLQRLERYERADGADCLRGQLRLTLPAGSRSAHGHVGFCPPFAETPAVQVSTDHDGVEAVVSATEVLPWGVRVECRLDEPAEEAVEIPVDLFVHFPA